jgi:transcriptional antiterminator NusG
VFPGHILIEMELDDSTLYFVRNTVGVTGFVGSNTKPAPLQPEEVENILNTLGESAPRAKPIWHKGEMVRVTSGPFVDHTGRIEEVNAKAEKVTALISLFGREIPVELDFSQVEKL